VHLRRGLKVNDYLSMSTTLPFILQLRCACETVFDVMLSAHIEGLKAYYVRSEEKGKKEGSERPSLDGWVQALQSANRALVVFREAEVQRKDGDLDSADATADQALLALHERYKFYLICSLINRSLFPLSTEAVPTFYRSRFIMRDWDDVEVRKA
jgi:hypothetical protein